MLRMLLWFSIIYCLHFTLKAIPSFSYILLEASKSSQHGACEKKCQEGGEGTTPHTNFSLFPVFSISIIQDTRYFSNITSQHLSEKELVQEGRNQTSFVSEV